MSDGVGVFTRLLKSNWMSCGEGVVVGGLADHWMSVTVVSLCGCGMSVSLFLKNSICLHCWSINQTETHTHTQTV